MELKGLSCRIILHSRQQTSLEQIHKNIIIPEAKKLTFFNDVLLLLLIGLALATFSGSKVQLIERKHGVEMYFGRYRQCQKSRLNLADSSFRMKTSLLFWMKISHQDAYSFINFHFLKVEIFCYIPTAKINRKQKFVACSSSECPHVPIHPP